MKAILIDDEPNSTEALEQMLRLTCPDVEVVGIANSAQNGLEIIRKHAPDVIFLDIQMPHMTGFELLEKLGKVNFAIIFTTAHDQYALQAFKVSAADYLLKPIDMDELENAVEKVRNRMKTAVPDFGSLESLFRQMQKTEVKRLVLPTGDGLVFVNLSDIVRLESDSNYTMFHLVSKQKILVSRTLGEYENVLLANDFCRIHHSHLINLAQLRRYIKTDGGYAEMSDGSKIEISRRKKEEFLLKIGELRS